jgi:signal transduction histidine kinase
MIVIFNDITYIKNLESITNKMKSMFFASIAHELRTPLNTIIPMSNRLKQSITDSKDKVYLNIIISSAAHLQNLIEDALDMSRIENNKFEVNLASFNIREIIEETASIMRFQIEQKKL